MNENTQDIDLNNDVVNDVDTDIDDVSAELEELRAYKAAQEEAKAQAERNKEAAKRRLAQKPITKSNLIDQDLAKDIAEFKFDRKVSKFAEENGLSKTQAEKVLLYKPDATAEDLKDEFIKAGIEALAKKTKVEQNTPRGRNAVSSTPAKSLSEMTPAEKEAWYLSR